MTGVESISVIVPTLNEAGQLDRCLERLVHLPGVTEVIVSDGGSQDATLAVAARYAKIRIIRGAAGRGRQMNRAARLARGRFLWFVHADSVPSPRALPALRAAIARPRTVAAALRLTLDASGAAYRLIEQLVWLRCRWFQRPYGDQTFFVPRELFWAVGGFVEGVLMEDLYLVRALVRRGRVVTVREPVLASARRWQTCGILATTCRHWGMVLRDWLSGPFPLR